MTLQLTQEQARRAFIERQGLASDPTRKLTRDGLHDLIHRLGFVQVDSVQTVERAHHLILFSRNQTYKREDLAGLLEEDRRLFEHWTHDASIIPVEFWPYWKHRFRRHIPVLRERWQKWQGEGFDRATQETLDHVHQRGECLSRELKQEESGRSTGWWDWHPNKTALEYLWHAGELAISRRQGFQKVYDLARRVIPKEAHDHEVTEQAFIDWACRAALTRLGFATHGEIAAFFALVSPQEAKAWTETHAKELRKVAITLDDRKGSKGETRMALAFADQAEQLVDAPEPPSRVRVLSPFDPMLRDRSRAERLFDFHYRIEIFVPEPKRVYGYYVFPLMEGDSIIGRIDMKAERNRGVLEVKRLWLEPGVKLSKGRMAKLEAELDRLARFSALDGVTWLDGWQG